MFLAGENEMLIQFFTNEIRFDLLFDLFQCSLIISFFKRLFYFEEHNLEFKVIFLEVKIFQIFHIFINFFKCFLYVFKFGDLSCKILFNWIAKGQYLVSELTKKIDDSILLNYSLSKFIFKRLHEKFVIEIKVKDLFD